MPLGRRGQNGGTSSQWERRRRDRARPPGQVWGSAVMVAMAGWSSTRCRWPWSSRQAGGGVGRWPGGGAVWCSRQNSSSEWGPSGLRVRARLVPAAGVGVGGAGSSGGVGEGGDPVGGECEGPAGSLFDPVVASAQGEQVVVAGGSGGPGSDVVEVAEHGGDAAAGEPAPPVPGPDPVGHPLRGPI